ncbi:MAG: NADH-quinone oxidoreductase subunit J [bacterium]
MLFLICALGMVGSGVVLVASRQPVTAVIALISVFLLQSVLYVLLHAPFIAAIQVIVYTGAIMVLFIFVVMLLNLKERQTWETIGTRRRLMGILLGLGIVLILGLGVSQITLTTERIAEDLGSPQKVGKTLFDRYALPLEMVALLLLIAIVAVMEIFKKGVGGKTTP